MAGKPANDRQPAPTLTEIMTGIELPDIKPTTRVGAASVYPFDKMEVGAIFGVKDRNKKGVSPAVSNANRKYKQNVTDDAGNTVYETKPLIGADGTVTNIPDISKPKKIATRHFTVIEVTPDVAKAIAGIEPLKGAKVLIKRDT